MRILFLSVLMFLLPLTSSVLIAQTEIFPELTGDALLEALVDEYKTQVLLSLTEAKDTLYSKIEAREDSVHGIYTDYVLYLPPGEDPSQALFMNGAGLNLEHSWPQSKGAGSGKPGRTDMHHLYPSRVIVNSERASFPFGEINDNTTDNWYYKAIARTTIPTTNIDFYSEAIDGKFEPRESVKGDIARGMFYFYTMYKDDADNADPNFFEEQKSTLCSWHYADPVDEAELARTHRIADYQGGKVNPFVLDCTLAERTYCPDGGQCSTVATTRPNQEISDLHIVQNGCNINLIVISNSSGKISNSIINSSGQLLLFKDTTLIKGENIIDFNGCNFPQGIYFLNSIIKSSSQSAVKTLKFVIAG
jgi:hypothetical protein